MSFPWQTMYANPPRDLLRLNFVTAVSTTVRFDLLNNTAEELVIASIFLNWPQANEAIFNFLKGGVAIWSGFDGTPPTLVDGGWLNTIANRTYLPRESDRIEAFFGLSAQQSGYEMIVTFDNGWEVRAVE